MRGGASTSTVQKKRAGGTVDAASNIKPQYASLTKAIAKDTAERVAALAGTLDGGSAMKEDVDATLGKISAAQRDATQSANAALAFVDKVAATNAKHKVGIDNAVNTVRAEASTAIKALSKVCADHEAAAKGDLEAIRTAFKAELAEFR